MTQINFALLLLLSMALAVGIAEATIHALDWLFPYRTAFRNPIDDRIEEDDPADDQEATP